MRTNHSDETIDELTDYNRRKKDGTALSQKGPDVLNLNSIKNPLQHPLQNGILWTQQPHILPFYPHQ